MKRLLVPLLLLTMGAALRGDGPPLEAVVTGKIKGLRVLDLSFELPPVAHSPCAIEPDGRFACRLPKRKLDLRLAAEGMAPWYFWDVDFTVHDRVDLGELVPRQGGSVSGRVDRPGAIVTLHRSAFNDEKSALQTWKATANGRGFFQFSGISPGAYTVEAEAPSASPAVPVEVEVRDAREYALDRPLRLEPLAQLQVAILPPLDPFGKNWRIGVARFVPLSMYVKPVAQGAASDAGFWKQENRAAGRHRVAISDSAGNQHYSQEVDLRSDTPLLAVHVSFVRIAGIVRAGERPLAATVRLDSLHGERVIVRSNAEGRFESFVPFEGKWSVEIAPAGSRQTLRPPPVVIHKSPIHDWATVDFMLPGGTIDGKVVDEDGNPIKAGVVLSRTHAAPLSDAVSAADGKFVMLGIEPGTYEVRAETANAVSNDTSITIGDKTETVTLVARHRRTRLMWVGTASGEPLAGAIVRYWMPSSAYISEESTSPGGTFQLDVTRQEPITLIVVAPGAPRAITTVMPNDGRREITVAAAGGRLRVIPGNTPPWPRLVHNGASGALPQFFAPSGGGMPPEFQPDGVTLDLEPGDYAVCSTQRCENARILPGAVASVDIRGEEKKP